MVWLDFLLSLVLPGHFTFGQTHVTLKSLAKSVISITGALDPLSQRLSYIYASFGFRSVQSHRSDLQVYPPQYPTPSSLTAPVRLQPTLRTFRNLHKHSQKFRHLQLQSHPHCHPAQLRVQAALALLMTTAVGQ